MPSANPAAIVADAVLGANQAFYDALNARDLDAMDALWSRISPVACIHPGWAPLTERDNVMQSFRAILGSRDTPEILCQDPQVLLWGEFALVVCFERLGEAVLAAANTFRLEEGIWRLVHHQAGPAAEGPEPDLPPPGRRQLH
ncbi:MAG: nuclear transport factor 2 family protein [Acetobacteraceae bacterium]|nr:nuclear transport factor 2 family protein [Acetobacteraceae bacterium]